MIAIMRGRYERDMARGNTRVLTPEDAIAYLDERAATAQATKETICGYRVKVTHKAVSVEERDARRQAIAQVLRRSLKHLKDSD